MTNYKPTHVILGGAFDPPHISHFSILKTLSQHFPHAEILALPNSHSPSQSSNVINTSSCNQQYKSIQTSFHHRLTMLKLGKTALNLADNVVISQIEKDMPNPNTTWHTLQKLGSKENVWVVGGDHLLTLKYWHRIQDILNTTAICIIPRNTPPTHQERCQKTFSDLHTITQEIEYMCMDISQQPQQQEPLAAHIFSYHKNLHLWQWQNIRVFILTEIPPAISSSTIRNMLGEYYRAIKSKSTTHNQFATLLREWLPEVVLDYIIQHDLYTLCA